MSNRKTDSACLLASALKAQALHINSIAQTTLGRWPHGADTTRASLQAKL